MEHWSGQESKSDIAFKHKKMKKIYFVVVGLLGILGTGCYSDDDSNRFIVLNVQDAIVFENDQDYVVGDTIYVELNFSRYLDEEGFPNKLDIFESTGAESFRYDFGLNRDSDLAEGFRRIEISSEFLLPEKGTADGFGSATAQLNIERTRYESRFGIILAEAGRFELDMAFIYLYSEAYFEDKVQIEILHDFVNTVPNFEFTVN